MPVTSLPAAPQLSLVAQDPMNKLIDLPSGGLFYECGVSQVRIRPTRGEQEEMIAATPEESPDRVRAIREVTRQCTDLQGLNWNDLLILDFAHVSIHLFALSAGSDEVTLPDSLGCEKDDCPMRGKKLTLTTLPCVYLQLGEHGQSYEVEELDPDILAVMEAERAIGEAEEEGGPEYRKVDPETIREPFRCKLKDGTELEWRLHRMKDLEAAEEYSKATGDTGLGTKAKLGSFLSARQIVAINGQSRGTVGALQWWKQAPSPILREFRRTIRAMDFGYNMRPEFRCPRGDCRKKVRVKLPNDGSLFRDGA